MFAVAEAVTDSNIAPFHTVTKREMLGMQRNFPSICHSEVSTRMCYAPINVTPHPPPVGDSPRNYAPGVGLLTCACVSSSTCAYARVYI